MSSPLSGTALLEVEEAEKTFPADGATVRAVDGVSLSVEPGEIFGVVGESGSGKSTLARLVLKLTPLTAGRISFDGERIDELPEKRFRERRRDMQIVLQDPLASFDPRWKITRSMGEFLQLRSGFTKATAAQEAVAAAASVGLDPAILDRYPAQVSGGQLQRLSIARSLASNPKLLVVDEPTSSLDVSIRGQIVNLLLDEREARQLTIVLISHDLSVVRAMSDRVAVMYRGQIVEIGPAADVLERPAHPYTRGLLEATSFARRKAATGSARLRGELADDEACTGCRLLDRCPLAEERCRETQSLRPLTEGHEVRCWKATA